MYAASREARPAKPICYGGSGRLARVSRLGRTQAASLEYRTRLQRYGTVTRQPTAATPASRAHVRRGSIVGASRRLSSLLLRAVQADR